MKLLRQRHRLHQRILLPLQQLTVPLARRELRLRLRAVAMHIAIAAQQRVGLLLQQGIQRITALLLHLHRLPDRRLLAAQPGQIRLHLLQRNADGGQIALADHLRQLLILRRRQQFLPALIACLRLGDDGFQLRELAGRRHRPGIIERLGGCGGDEKSKNEKKETHGREGQGGKGRVL